MQALPDNLIDLVENRDREGVFNNRHHAGLVLARLMTGKIHPGSIILAIPAGGVPVACALADVLDLRVDVMVVSKITFPWNSEAGYGAVAQNGVMRLNERILKRVRVSDTDIQAGIAATTAKVNRRFQALNNKKTPVNLDERHVILVDDGLASGTTMSVAMEAVARWHVASMTLALPTAHRDSFHWIGDRADQIFCANVRSGPIFAVAAAYHHWSDVSEARMIVIMAKRRR